MKRFIVSFSFLGFVLASLVGLQAQQQPSQGRMAVMHRNPAHNLTLVDPSTGVGQYLSTSTLPATVNQPQAWPSVASAYYVFGYASESPSIVRLTQAGTYDSTVSFAGTFTSIAGATGIRQSVPTGQFGTICGANDLQDHYAMVGALPSGGSGLMLVNPATLTNFTVGGAACFSPGTTSYAFKDVAFCTYAGPDGDYGTIGDNRYRYVIPYQRTGSAQGGLAVFSLTSAQTANGAGRGPSYTAVNPVMDANVNTFGETTLFSDPAGNMFCRTYQLRGGIPYCTASPNKPYALVAFVTPISIIPPQWSVVLSAYDLGNSSFNSLAPVASISFGPFTSANVLSSLNIVGDWAFVTVGPGTGDGLGDMIECLYVPELVDGIENPSTGSDNGVRGSWSAGGSGGFAGYFPDTTGEALITYFGTGGTSIYGTNRSPYQDWGSFPSSGIQNTPSAMTEVPCQNVAPQPVFGYYRSGSQGPPPPPPPPTIIPPGPTTGGGSSPGSGCSAGVGTSGWIILIVLGVFAARPIFHVRLKK